MTLPSRSRMAHGGRSRSRAKLSALAALHAARRGRHVHPSAADLRRALVAAYRRGLRAAGGNPMANRYAIRRIAATIGVSDRTVRRWMSGEDHPDPHYHPCIRRAIQ